MVFSGVHHKIHLMKKDFFEVWCWLFAPFPQGEGRGETKRGFLVFVIG